MRRMFLQRRVATCGSIRTEASASPSSTSTSRTSAPFRTTSRMSTSAAVTTTTTTTASMTSCVVAIIMTGVTSDAWRRTTRSMPCKQHNIYYTVHCIQQCRTPCIPTVPRNSSNSRTTVGRHLWVNRCESRATVVSQSCDNCVNVVRQSWVWRVTVVQRSCGSRAAVLQQSCDSCAIFGILFI